MDIFCRGVTLLPASERLDKLSNPLKLVDAVFTGRLSGWEYCSSTCGVLPFTDFQSCGNQAGLSITSHKLLSNHVSHCPVMCSRKNSIEHRGIYHEDFAIPDNLPFALRSGKGWKLASMLRSKRWLRLLKHQRGRGYVLCKKVEFVQYIFCL